MQNRYVGDVGDYGKYGLLRSLCRKDSRMTTALFPSRSLRFDGRVDCTV